MAKKTAPSQTSSLALASHISAEVSGTENQVIVGGTGADQSNVSQTARIERERHPAFRLLAEMQSKIENDTGLGADERSDFLNDLESLRRQLLKREPNRPSIAALLVPLSQIASIAGQVATLIKWLNSSG